VSQEDRERERERGSLERESSFSVLGLAAKKVLSISEVAFFVEVAYQDEISFVSPRSVVVDPITACFLFISDFATGNVYRALMVRDRTRVFFGRGHIYIYIYICTGTGCTTYVLARGYQQFLFSSKSTHPKMPFLCMAAIKTCQSPHARNCNCKCYDKVDRQTELGAKTTLPSCAKTECGSTSDLDDAPLRGVSQNTRR
jgi:hypothetical protein